MRPNYTRRRIIAALAAIGIGWVLVESTDHYDDAGRYSCDAESVTVGRGDNLWSIAAEHCSGDIRRVAELLTETYGVLIYPSQVISLPN